ncbi:hypothetical protein ACYPKM_01200 [Pseudomonas aeruginosa]
MNAPKTKAEREQAWLNFISWFVNDRQEALRYQTDPVADDYCVGATEHLDQAQMGAALILAALHGDTNLVKMLDKDFPQLNGVRFEVEDKPNGLLVKTKTGSQLIAREEPDDWGMRHAQWFGVYECLIAVYQRTGATALTPWFVEGMIGKNDVEYSEYEGWKGVLPELVDGFLKNSGLAQALEYHAAKLGADPAWLDDILVWAEKSIGDTYPKEMSPLISDPRVRLYGEETLYEYHPMSETDFTLPENLFEIEDRGCGLEVGVYGDGRSENILDRALCDAFLAPQHAYGVGFTKTRRLYRTKVSFLRRFEFDKVSDVPLAASGLRNYYPLTPLYANYIMHTKGLGDDRLKVADQRKKHTCLGMVNAVCKDERTLVAMREPELRPIFRAFIRAAAKDRVQPSFCILYKDELGLGTSGLEIELDYNTVGPNFLRKGLVRFDPGTRLKLVNSSSPIELYESRVEEVLSHSSPGVIVDDVDTSMETPELIRRVFLVLKAGENAMATKANIILLKELARRDLSEITPHIKGKVAWQLLEKVVGAAALAPYYAKIPRNLRVKVAGVTLSL